MKKRAWVYIVVSALAVGLYAAAGICAGTALPTELQIKTPYERTKNTIPFTHKKHVDDHKVACGECHHDDKGKPLTGLKEGDAVKFCIDCHNKPGEISAKEAKGLSKEEVRAYHAEAVHENCIGCHRTYNKEKKTKATPVTCMDCHPKKGK